MAYNKHENSYEINEQQLEAYLADTLARVESDNDPDTLNKLKKIFKKNIPFSRRMYVAAFLVKQASMGYRPNSRFNRNERFSQNRNTERNDRRAETNHSPRAEKFSRPQTERTEPAEHVEKAPRVQIDEALATTIFIGIGRNRRVYPRDLVGLLVSVAGLERERIGDIRVLANYSFIQLFTEDCEKAINSLNGYEYRGRKLSVSYSRQKEDEAEESAEKETEVTETAEKTEAPVFESSPIPENVTNEAHADYTENTEEKKLAEEQKAFAQSQAADVSTKESFTETTDDGQIKSHFTSANY